MVLVVDDIEALLVRVRALTASGRRAILGIAGPPGAGKSTLARSIVAALVEGEGAAACAVLVPMDGFHLAQAELVRLGRRDRMAPPTPSTRAATSRCSSACAPAATRRCTRRSSGARSRNRSRAPSPCRVASRSW